MKQKIYLFTILFICLAGSGCKKLNDKFEQYRTDPSGPSPDKANIDLYLNHVQLSFRNFWGNDRITNPYSLTELGASLTRMEILIGGVTYANVYVPETFDELWDQAYRGVINHSNTLIPLAEKAGLTTHTGIAKILKAYTLIALVDNFGDVPNTEAILGSENTNPKTDKGDEVYTAALALLDAAITDFKTAPSGAPLNDLFYGGDVAKWTTLAKTLKLRAYMTTRLVNAADSKAKISALLTENDLVDTDAEEFVFRYGTQLDNPVSRHPKFTRTYRVGFAQVEWVGTYFLWSLTEEKGMADPRTRYYVYRQRTTSINWNGQQLPCGIRTKPAHYPASAPYCILPNGYWGRDHGNNDPIPQDNEKRTIYGVYYAGGKFDNDDNRSGTPDDGAKGAGIHPIWMASYTEFLKAEAALTLATTGDPKTLLEGGIRKSIARVIAFPGQIGVTVPATRVPTTAQINSYVTKVLSNYDAASTDGKLNIVMKEWYMALWGNGYDAYNNYRRTGKPDDMQPMVNSTPGPFIRTFWYPAVTANLNKSTTQKADLTQKVFWDKNPDPLK
ncbi:MAG: SusD/RagB family nutrient-binding outer membrane lipoprotein [Chitinophagaceae bacterium]|nr:SusD/RagB family nutrient-binding outer membrane lipoprotein [Chitinophagaceae bacterium]